MIISDLNYLEVAESTNIAGGSMKDPASILQYQKISQYVNNYVDQHAKSSSYANAFRGNATATSTAYNDSKISSVLTLFA